MSEFRIFDVHQHMGNLQIGHAAAERSLDEDFTLRSADLDKFGFASAIAMPSLQYSRPRGFADTQAINDGIAGYRNQYRARFPVAVGTVQPSDPLEMSLQEIERMATELKLDGVVWHHRFQGVFLNDRRMNPLLDACVKHKLVVFIHVISGSNMEAPWLMEELYEAHPDVTFVALDPLSGVAQIRYVMQMAKRCSNMYFDTAFNIPNGRSIENFVEKFGSERLLFGTDKYLHPGYVYPHVMREILDAPNLTDDDRRNIFWNNAQRLFPHALEKLN